MPCNLEVTFNLFDVQGPHVTEEMITMSSQHGEMVAQVRLHTLAESSHDRHSVFAS